MEWISKVAEIVQAAAVGIGVWLAYRGLNQWKEEYHGTRNAELAEETLLAANGVRSAISRVRSPFTYVGEGLSRHRDQDEPADKRAFRDMMFAPIERLQKEQPAFDRLSQADARCRVKFGSNLVPHVDAFLTVYRDVAYAARSRFHYGHDNNGVVDPAMQDLWHEWERVVWFTENDAIQQRLDEAVSGLESELQKYLHEK